MESGDGEVLMVPDELPAPQVSRFTRGCLTVLARLPICHSIFWLCFVVWAALNYAEQRQRVMKIVIECWLLYSFTKYVITGFAATRGLIRLSRNNELDSDYWANKNEAPSAEVNSPGSSNEGEVNYEPVAVTKALQYDDVVHLVVIPSYKESIETLRRTLATVANQRDAKAAIVVVLAMEARDVNALPTATKLTHEFAQAFRAMRITLHTLQRGEVGGKSSNENWAVRCSKHWLVDECAVTSERVVITVCDADTYFHTAHFAALARSFADSKHRKRRFWQACTQFYPNSDDVPLLCSVRYALLSIGYLGQLSNPFHYKLPFACYSIALDLAIDACYWDPSVIPEDWHMFLRCFYATGGGVRVEPLFFALGCECVTDKTPFATIVSCYKQACRWQWGAIDIGFIATNTPSVKPHDQLAVAAAASEHHLLYPLMWIVLAAAPWLLEDWATGWRFRLWILFYGTNFVVLNILDAVYRRHLATQPKGAGGPHSKGLATFSLARTLAFAAFPLADLLLFVLPSLHAHMRMAISTNFTYVVAPKVETLRSLSSKKTTSSSKTAEAIPLRSKSPDISKKYAALS